MTDTTAPDPVRLADALDHQACDAHLQSRDARLSKVGGDLIDADRKVRAATMLAWRWIAESQEMRQRSVREGLHPALAGGHREANQLRQCAADLLAALEATVTP